MAIVYDDKIDWVSEKRMTTNMEATQLFNTNSMDTGEKASSFGSNALKTRLSETSTDDDNADDEKILRIYGKCFL